MGAWVWQEHIQLMEVVEDLGEILNNILFPIIIPIGKYTCPSQTPPLSLSTFRSTAVSSR